MVAKIIQSQKFGNKSFHFFQNDSDCKKMNIYKNICIENIGSKLQIIFIKLLLSIQISLRI